MHVRTMLHMNVWLTVLAAMAVLLLLSLSLHRVRNAMENAAIADDIIRATFERSAFRTDYLQNSSERAKQQWFAKQAEIGGLLAAAARNKWSSDDRILVDTIRKDYETEGKLFPAIVSGREKTGQSAPALFSEMENRLLTQLVMGTYAMIQHAHKLQETSRDKLFAAVKLAGISLLSVLTVMVVIILGTSWNMRRLIADRLTSLWEGAVAVGKGDLGYRIGLDGDDEFVELSKAFDGMTAKLHQSHLDLEREITERRRGEAALRESEARFRGTFENAAVGIALLDGSGNVVQANAKLCEIIGYGEDEVPGRSFRSFTHPDDLEPDQGRYARLMRGELGSYEMEKRYLRKDGSSVWVRVSRSALRQERGLSAYSISIVQDISARKETEEKLNRSRGLLSEAERLSHTGAWEWDVFTDIWTFSDEWLSIHGLQQRMLKPDELLAIAHPEDRAAVKEGFEGARSGVKQYQLEHRIIRQDTGEIRVVRARGKFVKDSAGAVVRVYGFAQDITQQKRVEEELRKAKDELEERVRERTEELHRAMEKVRVETEERLHALEELRKKEQLLLQQNRLAAMGEMLVNISHQWRQPLNVLGLILQELARSYRRGTFSAEFLETRVCRAKQVISHMSQTIDDFRDFLNPDKTKTVFNVKDVVETSLSMLADSFRETQVDVRVAAESDVSIEGFRNEYAQAVMNILINARDAFRERNVANPQLTITIFRHEGKSVATFADNAGGIDGDVIDRVFEPYFTTKTADKGTGIGLFMSKMIIERNMQGTLSVNNTDDGALFRIEV